MDNIIEERKKWLDSHFFIKPQIVHSINDMDIVRRKEYWGLYSKKNEVNLPTIFDDLMLINPNVVKVQIKEKSGFYDICSDKWIIKPLCDSYYIDGFYNSIEIVQEGKHGLIDLDEHRLLVAPVYNAVSRNSKCRYLWIKEGVFYHYIKQSTCQRLNMPGALYAYDTNTEENVMFIKKRNNIVECVDEKGNIDIISFRQIMVKNNGRLKLYNSQQHSFDIIDIYGRILN